jgi:hypothetical protein
MIIGYGVIILCFGMATLLLLATWVSVQVEKATAKYLTREY